MIPKVVFDTNVYIRALLNPKSGASSLLWLMRVKLIQLYISRGQIAELNHVVADYFSDPQSRQYIHEADFIALRDMLDRFANLVPTTKVNKVSPDADDDLIIGIAIKAKAGYLVTENPKHIHQRWMPKQPPIEVLNIKEGLKKFRAKRQTDVRSK